MAAVSAAPTAAAAHIIMVLESGITFCNGDDGKLKFVGEGEPPRIKPEEMATYKLDVSFHDVTAAELQKALKAIGLT